MGCGGSTPADNGGGSAADTEADLKSKQLEEELERQQAQENAIIKLLVLGTGESGKSTVFKQMKILYSVPDPPSKFIMICRANLFGNAHAVMEGMKRLGIAYGDGAGEEAGKVISAVPPDGNPDNIGDLVAPLKTLYADKGVIEAIERANEYQLNDSTRYFWERAEEICSSSYMPSEQDVLRARVRTTGIVQQNFQIGDKKYTMFDVGGQRNERRKWIHCFDNVTAVIFVTAISEFDQVPRHADGKHGRGERGWRARGRVSVPPLTRGVRARGGAWRLRRCCTRTRTRTAWTRRSRSSTRSATTRRSRRRP